MWKVYVEVARAGTTAGFSSLSQTLCASLGFSHYSLSTAASCCHPLKHYRQLSPKRCHSLAAHHQPTVFQAAPWFHLPPCRLFPHVLLYLLFRRLDPLPHGVQDSPGTPAQVADFSSLNIPSWFYCCYLQNTLSAPSCRQAALATLGQAVHRSYPLPSCVAKPQPASHFAVVRSSTGETPGNC